MNKTSEAVKMTVFAAIVTIMAFFQIGVEDSHALTKEAFFQEVEQELLKTNGKANEKKIVARTIETLKSIYGKDILNKKKKGGICTSIQSSIQYPIESILEILDDPNNKRTYSRVKTHYNNLNARMGCYNGEDKNKIMGFLQDFEALIKNLITSVEAKKKEAARIAKEKKEAQARLVKTMAKERRIAEKREREIKYWERKGFSESQKNVWENAGYNLEDAITFKKHNISATKAKQLKFRQGEIKRWDNIQWGLYKETENMTIPLKEAGITPDEFYKWMNAKYSIADAISYKKEGKTLKEAQEIEAEAKEREEIIIKIVILLYAAMVLYGIFLGLTDRAIIYMDSKDLWLSFSPMGTVMVFGILAFFTWQWVAYIGLAIAAFLAVFILVRNFVFNDKKVFTTLATWMTKMSLSFVAFLLISNIVNPAGQNATQRRERRTNATIWLAFLAPLIYKLVNGDRVVAQRQSS